MSRKSSERWHNGHDNRSGFVPIGPPFSLPSPLSKLPSRGLPGSAGISDNPLDSVRRTIVLIGSTSWENLSVRHATWIALGWVTMTHWQMGVGGHTFWISLLSVPRPSSGTTSTVFPGMPFLSFAPRQHTEAGRWQWRPTILTYSGQWHAKG